MRTTQAAKYARWSAMLALFLAVFVAGTYVRRAWQEHQASKTAPSAVPSAVQQRSAEFSYSKVTGSRTEFTVRASHATQFTEGGRILLEDVWVTFYGDDGLRADNLHTRTCEFFNTTGKIVCNGEVRLDLQSAEDARLFAGTFEHPNAGAHVAHIVTSHVSFERATGATTTDQLVTFRFPQGQGHAMGLRYDSRVGELQLLHDVDLTFLRTTLPGAGTPAFSEVKDGGQPLHVTGSSLLYRRDARVIHLQGPVDAQQGGSRLVAGRLTVELDEMQRARRIVANEQPKLNGMEHGEPVLVSADELSASVSTQGAVERMIAAGNVHATSKGAMREDRLDAGRAVVEMNARPNQPALLTATQNVIAESVSSGGVDRRLASATLEVKFAPDAKTGEASIASASTPAATLDWQAPADSSSKTLSQHVHMTSQALNASFGASSELREVRGTGGVEVTRQMGSGPSQTSSSRDVLARVQPGGDWSTLDQTGDVRMREGDQVARADSAHFDHAADTAVLTGSVAVADAQRRLTARSGTFHHATNEFHAEGHVVTLEVPSNGGGASNLGASNLGKGPARISADRLDVNSASGHALYSGQARLWQGDALIEADSIDLSQDPSRTESTITANGQVRAVFPQAAWLPSKDRPLPASSGRPMNRAIAQPGAQPVAGKAEFWRVQANRLIYRSAEGQVHLEQRVITRSDQGTLKADAMDLYFASPSPVAISAPLAAKVEANVASAIPGPQQLTRATALGNVVVEQEDRRGTSSHAEYVASEGKFVLTGGPPVVHDSSGNTTTGRQLTLFFADDRIVIDSAEGLRTVTLHQVEK